MTSLLGSRNCVLHLRTMLDFQRIQKKVSQTKTGCNLYRGQRDQERRYPWSSTRQDRSTKRIPYGLNAWKRCCKKVDLTKVNILQVFTIDFSEIQFIVNHNSQSDGQNKSAKSGMNLHKKTIHIISLQRKRKDTKDNGILP